MNRIWLVAKHEYLTNIKKPSFLFAMFGIPLFIVVVMVVVSLITASSIGGGDVEVETAGYVDRASILQESVRPDGFEAYDTVETARDALIAGDIQAYFVMPEAYLLTGNVALYAQGTTTDDFQDRVEDYIADSLATDIESDLSSDLLRDPVNMSFYMENTGRELSGEGFLGLFLVPFAFSMVFLLGIQLTSQYLMSGVAEEKGNRVIEILITSLTPLQLLAGKMFGMGAIGLTQIIVWLAVGLIGLNLGQDLEFLASVEIPLDLVLLALVYFVFSYFMYAALLAAIGSVVGSEQESRQTATPISLLIALPFFFIFSFLMDPNGTIPVILTLLPFTSAVTVILRSAFTMVPPIEIIASLVILAGSSVFFTWAAAKVFRWGLLLYGKKIGMKDVLRVVLGRVEIGSTAVATETAKERVS